MICKNETSECKFYKVLWVNCALWWLFVGRGEVLAGIEGQLWIGRLNLKTQRREMTFDENSLTVALS